MGKPQPRIRLFFLLRSGVPLTKELFAEISDTAVSLGRERVHPDANHLRTDVTCLIVADDADDPGLAALKKWSYRENFKMSLHGWLDGRAALVTPGLSSPVRAADGWRTFWRASSILTGTGPGTGALGAGCGEYSADPAA